MNNRKKLSICILAFMLIFSIFSVKPIIENINYGLDLKGGFEVLYEIESLDDTEVTTDMMTATYKAINNRIDTLGVSEPEITIEGTNIRVQLPGVSDEDEARERLSTPAVLTFRNSSDEVLMTSEVLATPGASLDYSQTGEAVVALNISDTDLFYKVTKAISESEDQLIVIWLDFEEGVDSYEELKDTCGETGSSCISSATVSEAFSSNVIIQGSFTKDEANELIDLINSGSLPTKLSEISTKVVDASFGSETLTIAALAGVISLILITIIMTIMYRLSGFISGLCLIFYALVVFGTFNLIDGVLTLTGIAALILGIGMAIDSSIVTLEKIKDELLEKKSLKIAYKEANKRSLSALLDANITTFIVALILFIFGESTVKGFGLMLILTIIVTIITMILINRVVLKGIVEMKNITPKIFIGNVKEKKKLSFIKYSKAIIAAAILIVITSIIFLNINGMNLGIDFTGGSNITLKSDEINQTKIEEILSEYEIVEYTSLSDDTVEIKIKEAVLNEEIETLKTSFDENDYTSEITVISNIVKKDLTINAVKAVLIAATAIMIFISIRNTFKYGISSIIALLIDITMVFGIFIIFKIEINFIFIASILTIIGYSINNTIIIFDLIKETKKNNDKLNNEEIVEISLNKSLTRSILTTITTLIAVILLLILGASEIQEFNIAIIIGLTSGILSSIFIAPYVWIMLANKKPKEKKEEYDDGPEEKEIKGINS